MMRAGVRSGLAARRPVIALALCGALLPDVAAAAPWAGVLPVETLAAAGKAAASEEPTAADASRAAQDEKLEQMRGSGNETPWSDMKLAGTVANNSAVNVVTGSNIVTDSAFSNASGLPMVIQNSGANVLIQNATIINVQIK